MVAGIFDDTMLELRQCQGIEIIREKFCVAGRGFYQEEGKEAICMTAGDVINIPAGVKHWHGAAEQLVLPPGNQRFGRRYSYGMV